MKSLSDNISVSGDLLLIYKYYLVNETFPLAVSVSSLSELLDEMKKEFCKEAEGIVCEKNNIVVRISNIKMLKSDHSEYDVELINNAGKTYFKLCPVFRVT